MRRTLLIATFFFLSLASTPQFAQAAGNVLLPSTPSDLGLGGSTAPSQDSSGNSGATAPTQPVLMPSETSSSQSPALSGVTLPSELSGTTSAKSTATRSTPAPDEAVPAMPTVTLTMPNNAKAAKHLPPGSLPTMVIHQSDSSDMLAQAQKDLPYTLTISMSDKSIFGAKDAQEIQNKLGISSNKDASSCILTVRGIMRTDKGVYPLSGKATSQVNVNYDGIIKSYLMSGRALCTVSGELPAGSGLLTEIGDRYSIPLQSITCPAPKRQVTTLTITYDGSGTSQCVYD
jgi:hypothetical protein